MSSFLFLFVHDYFTFCNFYFSLQKQAIAALNSTSVKQGDLLHLWRKLNSTDKDLRDVKEQVHISYVAL